MSRSSWKFNYLAQDFMAQEQDYLRTKEIIVHNRASYITEEMVGYTVKVYNGMKFFSFIIENDKIGHHVGEFSPTKKKATKKKKTNKKK